jgi:pyruvate formate lyase activating enzyme
MDPIEKKPLYHFRPGTPILSVGQNGCNLACQFCQNWHISQNGAPESEAGPEQVVSTALARGSEGIAYTYNEPLIGFEFVLDCARLAREQGLANVLVTNGFLNPAPLDELLPLVDALNVDLKSLDDGFYRRLCEAGVDPVLETLVKARGAAHLEVTNLVIPGENDTTEGFEALAAWLADNLGSDVPVHLSAYFPAFRMSNPPTPLETLVEAREILGRRLNHVYLGNVRSAEGRDTACHACGALLVERKGYATTIAGLSDDGRCEPCGADNNFVMRLPS